MSTSIKAAQSTDLHTLNGTEFSTLKYLGVSVVGLEKFSLSRGFSLSNSKYERQFNLSANNCTLQHFTSTVKSVNNSGLV